MIVNLLPRTIDGFFAEKNTVACSFQRRFSTFVHLLHHQGNERYLVLTKKFFFIRANLYKNR